MCKNNKMKLFFPIWHWKIPKELIDKYDCIGFHITDLPFGRGGHPLQNLIVRGITTTKLTAFRITDDLDGGEILLQRNLSLHGTADEIWKRASDIIVDDMIPYLMENDVEGKPQTGEVVEFKRFAPVEITEAESLAKMHDFIRMSDSSFYDKAFLDTDLFRFEFFDCNKTHNKLVCRCHVIKKPEPTIPMKYKNIYDQVFDEPPRDFHKFIENLMTKYKTEFFEVTHQKELVGCGLVLELSQGIYGVSGIAILPGYQGKGYGKELMNKIHDKYRGVFLLRTINESFYKSLKYKTIYSDKKYWYMVYCNDGDKIKF